MLCHTDEAYVPGQSHDGEIRRQGKQRKADYCGLQLRADSQASIPLTSIGW